MKARTHVHVEIAHFPPQCIIRTWKALALMMHLVGKFAISARTWSLATWDVTDIWHLLISINIWANLRGRPLLEFSPFLRWTKFSLKFCHDDHHLGLSLAGCIFQRKIKASLCVQAFLREIGYGSCMISQHPVALILMGQTIKARTHKTVIRAHQSPRNHEASDLVASGPWRLPHWELCHFSMGMGSSYSALLLEWNSTYLNWLQMQLFVKWECLSVPADWGANELSHHHEHTAAVKHPANSPYIS